MMEKLGGVWFRDGVMVSDPEIVKFAEAMKDPKFSEQVFDECLAHNAFMQCPPTKT